MGTNEEINNPADGTLCINIAENSNEIRVYKLSVPSLKLSDRIPSIQHDFPELTLCSAFLTCATVITLTLYCIVLYYEYYASSASSININITMCNYILSISN